MKFEATINCAEELDRADTLSRFREQFLHPQINGEQAIYFCGNSLGLQPKSVARSIQMELEDWKNLGVEGHFHGQNPWFEYHKFLKDGLVALTGAKNDSEVTPMGSLTTNLHLLMVSFYRPDEHRYKIMIEGGAFPSDQYALETQCRFHGLDPERAIIELTPRTDAYTLRTSDIVECIEKNADQLALVLLSGIQYYTGQYFEIGPITEAGHNAGALVGWDLAHAISNVPLSLHQHQVDFAAWCSYKYLNSGPGGTAGIFVHERHSKSFELPRFGGWWGHQENERFQMKKGFKPMVGSDGWQLSNANILSMAAQKASLDIFLEAGMPKLREKSIKLTGFMEFLLQDILTESNAFKIITPENPEERGAQLSLLFDKNGREAFEELVSNGVILDWREPDTIRVAPAPLYNTFTEVFRFSQLLKTLLQ